MEVNEAPEEEGDGEKISAVKKPRKRMKDLRKKILTQMEFYFSYSNLHKDRFLKKEIDGSKDGYIDISLFLNFNKIHQLTDDADVIARSLTKSTVIEVHSNGKKLKRRDPLESLANVDNRTIYVEHLPRHIDHEWVKKLFSQCGDVLYVSLPRFKTTGDLKGFGFVEFVSKKEADKACEVLNNPPPLSGKAGRFPKWNKVLYQLKKKTGDESIEEPIEADKSKETVDEDPVHKACKKHKKRRRRTSENSTDLSTDATSVKKTKKDTEDTKNEGDSKTAHGKKRKANSSSEEGREESEDAAPMKKQKADVEAKEDSDVIVREEPVSDGLKSEDEKDGKRKKKMKKLKLSDSIKSVEEEDAVVAPVAEKDRLDRGKRKRASDSRESGDFAVPQAKVSKTDGRGVGSQVNADAGKKKRKRKKKKKHKEKKDVPLPQLRVISKQEWLKLRTEYLSLQKSNMAAMKQTLHQQKQEKNVNVVLEHNGEDKKTSSRHEIEFVTGVIVHVTCNTPMNRRTLKENLPSGVDVAYFDIKDEAMTGHIRCVDSKSAGEMSDLLLDEYSFSLLQGDSEKEYWDKLKADRDDKFNNTKRVKKRGTTKLIEKAHRHNAQVLEERKHIVFED